MGNNHRDKKIVDEIGRLGDKMASLVSHILLSFPDGSSETLQTCEFLPYKKNRKYDAIINGKRFRIRCMSYYAAALVNHSTRDKYLRVCSTLNLGMDELDRVIDEYWRLRLVGIIKEDVDNSSPDCPFRNHETYLKKLLSWFAFHSLNQLSDEFDNSCDYILDFEDPENEKTWVIYDNHNYLDKIWPHLRFSIRDTKGMPAHYDENDAAFSDIHPWVRKVYGRYKGALHIRINEANHYNVQHASFCEVNKDAIQSVQLNNQGERDELLFKLNLVRLRMENQTICLDNTSKNNIVTIGNKANENYKDFPVEYSVERLRNLSAPEMVALCKSVHIGKTSSTNKADVYINGIGVSVKSNSANPPSIINQTRRKLILQVLNKELHKDITPLDTMVTHYWDKRFDSSLPFGEDVRTSNPENPFDDKEYLTPILTYFAFEGSGKGRSASPATYVVEVNDPFDVNTWQWYDKNHYVPSIWNHLIFSIRGKGLPKMIDEDDLPWVRNITDKHGNSKPKGTLNVRVSR